MNPSKLRVAGWIVAATIEISPNFLEIVPKQSFQYSSSECSLAASSLTG
jgi:hypothetical protein